MIPDAKDYKLPKLPPGHKIVEQRFENGNLKKIITQKQDKFYLFSVFNEQLEKIKTGNTPKDL